MDNFYKIISHLATTRIRKVIDSIQFKQTLLGYNDYTQIYSAVNSLFSDTKKKKKPQSLSQEQKTENDDIHTDRFKHYMEGIVPLWTLTPPPPHPVHLRPPAFI